MRYLFVIVLSSIISINVNCSATIVVHRRKHNFSCRAETAAGWIVIDSRGFWVETGPAECCSDAGSGTLHLSRVEASQPASRAAQLFAVLGAGTYNRLAVKSVLGSRISLTHHPPIPLNIYIVYEYNIYSIATDISSIPRCVFPKHWVEGSARHKDAKVNLTDKRNN